MRRLFLLFSISIAALFCSYDLKAEAPKRQGWWKNIPLYGDVESVVMTPYELEEKFGEVVRGGILDCRKHYFNDAGDVIEYAWYYSDGSLREKEIYKYDSSGNMIEKARYNSDGSLGEKFIYKYDSRGNAVEVTVYVGEALIPISLIVFEITYRN